MRFIMMLFSDGEHMATREDDEMVQDYLTLKAKKSISLGRMVIDEQSGEDGEPAFFYPAKVREYQDKLVRILIVEGHLTDDGRRHSTHSRPH